MKKARPNGLRADGFEGNSFGTCKAYRTAKAALNQESVTLARQGEEGKNVTIVCMEPGFISISETNFNGEDDMDTCIDIDYKKRHHASPATRYQTEIPPPLALAGIRMAFGQHLHLFASVDEDSDGMSASTPDELMEMNEI
ncbi:hypothetical protein SCAR479_02325 [Seiridium cardinale]|uniref:Uncharacterized protein n=1 Tax=Seiridium cardinale TaxID=138064 RepID=A0ABR2X5M1_9PEZI